MPQLNIKKIFGTMRFPPGQAEKLLLKSMADNRFAGVMAISGTIIMQAAMVVRGLMLFNFARPKHIAYFGAYVMMLVLCLVTLYFYRNRPDFAEEKISRRALRWTYVMVTFICLWSVYVSILDMYSGNYPIVYLTVLLSIPFFCVLNPHFISVMAVLCAVLIACSQLFFLKQDIGSGFYYNLVIFCITNVCAAWRSYYILCKNYRLEQEMQRLYLMDQLTDINNRRSLDMKLEEVFPQIHEYILVLMDLDDFKTINDSYGHATGDKCLQIVSRYLRDEFGTEHVFRYGGDEFVILIREKADVMLKRLQSINSRLEKDVTQYYVRVSGGFYIIPKGASIETILSRADRALYDAKREDGKAQFVPYQD